MRAHDAAVLAALGYLKREAAWSRRGAQGRASVRFGGFVAAAFRYRTLRAGDPLLHPHVQQQHHTQRRIVMGRRIYNLSNNKKICGNGGGWPAVAGRVQEKHR